MKYFGEYLISKGLINEEQLVSCLIEQSKALPSMAEVVFKKKLLYSNQLLDILKFQYENKIDFRAACIALAFWSNELEAAIESELRQIRTPLGKLLIDSGLIEMSAVTKALDEFLATVSNVKGESKVVASETQQTLQPSSEEMQKSSGADPLLIEEFLSNLKPEKLSETQVLLTSLEVLESGLREESLQIILKDIHTIRGLLRSVGFQKLELLCAHYEKLCLSCISNLKKGQDVSLEVLSTLGVDLISMLLEFRTYIEQGKVESDLFSDETRKANFEKLVQSMSSSSPN